MGVLHFAVGRGIFRWVEGKRGSNWLGRVVGWAEVSPARELHKINHFLHYLISLLVNITSLKSRIIKKMALKVKVEINCHSPNFRSPSWALELGKHFSITEAFFSSSMIRVNVASQF